MKLMLHKTTSNPDFSALSAAELLGVVHNLHQQLCLKDSGLEQHNSYLMV